MDLIDQLDSLGKKVNRKHQYINSGGCAVFAAFVGRALANMGIDVKVIIGGGWGSRPGTNIEDARKNISDPGVKALWNENGVAFGHVGLEFEWQGKKYHYDSHGTKQPDGFLDGCTIHPGRMTLEECEAIADEEQGWNTCFSRMDIPSVRKLVEEFYNKTEVLESIAQL